MTIAETRERRNLYPYFVLLLFAVALMVVESNESWFRLEYPRADATWFYMAGKAWINGMTPYVEFTDSKGPLLWLIYGIGYLISPRSMHGLLPIQILFYWGTFIYLYKTILLFTPKKENAILGSMLMALFFFQPWIHFEIRAEDYCNFFNAMAMYAICCIFRRQEGLCRHYYYIGMAVAGTLLLKYNVALMLLAGCAGLLAYMIARKPEALWKSLLCWITGFATIALPFLIYFLATGSLKAFIREYFLITFQTIDIQHVHTSQGNAMMQLWPMTLVTYLFTMSYKWTLAIKIAFISIVFLCAKTFRPGWLRATILCWFVGAVVFTTYMISYRYLNILGIFTIFPVIWVMSKMREARRGLVLVGGAVVIFLVSYGATTFYFGEFYDVPGAKETEKQREEITALIETAMKGENRKPTVMYVRTYDHGYGIATETLPGSLYWSQQAGATLEMKQRHVDDIFSMRPDFVFIPACEKEITDSLEKTGYQRIYSYYPPLFTTEPEPELHYLYSKPQ